MCSSDRLILSLFISIWHNPEKMFWDRYHRVMMILVTLTQTCTHTFLLPKEQLCLGKVYVHCYLRIFLGLTLQHFPDWNKEEGQPQTFPTVLDKHCHDCVDRQIGPFKFCLFCFNLVFLQNGLRFLLFIHCCLLGCTLVCPKDMTKKLAPIRLWNDCRHYKLQCFFCLLLLSIGIFQHYLVHPSFRCPLFHLYQCP